VGTGRVKKIRGTKEGTLTVQSVSLSLGATPSFGTNQNPFSDLARAQNQIEDFGREPAPAPFPLSPWEDHTVYTTTDDITISIDVSRTVGTASGPKAEQGTAVIHEIVTTTNDSLHGTTTKTVVTSTAPGSQASTATAAQAAAVAGGGAQIDESVSITDKRTATETDYSTEMAGSPSAPTTKQTITISTVSKVNDDLARGQTLSFADPTNAPAVVAALQSLATTYGDDSELSKLLTGAYAPHFVNVIA
jgi:hypothetical protein